MSNIRKKRPWEDLDYNKAGRQKHRSWQLYNNEKNGLQQFQMESCQPIKGLKDEKKKNPFGHTVALGLTEPVKEINTSNISWGVKVTST